MFLCFFDRWVLRCHACYKVTQEIGKIFCPKCGNGGTLRKVSVTVGENGITMASRRPRVTLRGTKVSVFMLLIFLPRYVFCNFCDLACLYWSVIHYMIGCVVYFHACNVNDIQECSSEEQFL